MINRLLFLFFLVSVGLIIFVSGWAVSNYDVGRINLWMKQSVEMAWDKANPPAQTQKESEPYIEPVVDFKKIPSVKSSEDDFFANGIRFSLSAMKELPPVMIIRAGFKHVIAEYDNGSITTRTVNHNGEDLKGESYIIEGSNIFYRPYEDNDKGLYKRMQYTSGEAKLLWEKSIDKNLHHFGEIFEGVAYLPSRIFYDMPDDEMIELFKGKLFASCEGKELMSDTVVRFDWETGEVLEEFPLLPLVATIHEPYLEHIMRINCEDSLHLNDVQVLKTQEQAALFPDGKIGDMLVSMRNINTIMLVDKDTKENKWHITGLFNNQHSPRLTSRGTVLVFDNLGSLPKNGLSRIVEIDIQSKEIVGIYEATGNDLFFTHVRGRIQLLGDRIIIQEHNGGRLFEIVCPEDQTYLSTNCKKKIIFEVDTNVQANKFFNVAEFVEIE